MSKIWGIVLAAGASTRMKKQKMLLPYKGKTIIETVISNAIPALKKNIIVVLGANSDETSKKTSNFQIKRVENQRYSEGMLSSGTFPIYRLWLDAFLCNMRIKCITG